MKSIHDEINELSIALEANDPTIGANVVAIHKGLQLAPEITSLLSESEIATIIKGQEIVSLTKIIEKTAKKPASKANLLALEL